MSLTDRPLIFGEVLFDRFPDRSEVLGGAPFNVAWNLCGLGRAPLLMSRVGQDERGDRILGAMREFGMDCGGIQRDPEHPTGIVEIQLLEGEPRFDIVEDRAYDFIDPDQVLEGTSGDHEAFALLYHGSLALRSPRSAAAMEAVLDQLEGQEAAASVFFDVNLRPPWWQRDQLEEKVRTAGQLKLNEDELRALVPDGENLEDRARQLLNSSQATVIHVTRGARGAWALTSDGREFSTSPASTNQVVDVVGAGDAYSSVLILGTLEAWPIKTTMDRAQEFAGAVVGLRGATTTDPDFYARFQKTWGIS